MNLSNQWLVLCSKIKRSLTQSVTQWVTRSPIELFWTAKKIDLRRLPISHCSHTGWWCNDCNCASSPDKFANADTFGLCKSRLTKYNIKESRWKKKIKTKRKNRLIKFVMVLISVMVMVMVMLRVIVEVMLMFMFMSMVNGSPSRISSRFCILTQ